MDEDLEQKMQEEYDEVNDIMQAITELSGIFMKLYKEQIESVIVNNILPTYFQVFQNKSATEYELLQSTNIFDEILEHCSDKTFENALP